MRLANAMGLPWEEQFEPDSPEHGEFVELLKEVTYDFMRAGGQVTLTEWSGFTPLEREVAKDAGDMVRALAAAMTGLSAQGHHASILSVVDGGQTFISQKLNDLLNRVEGEESLLQGVEL
tara:strand:+ start:2139 stop:2498 length:360 start_codon:yes stop_codon:yes gene_type:complete